jgi:hypothetical protein
MVLAMVRRGRLVR